MRIALIGAAGQLGSELARLLPDAVPLTRSQIDLTNPAGVESVLTSLLPDLVINTAAYNFVDRAEDEPDLAHAVNELGPRRLAEWCAVHKATLVHVSTDYVFGADSTRTTPYVETDRPGPVSVYGASKLVGEQAVQQFCPRHFVVRTCGLYGTPSVQGKGNFVRTMLRLAGELPELRVVNDQHCTPSSAADVAEAIAELIRTDAYGLYHATNSGATTWFEVARMALELSGSRTPVIPIPTAAYPTRARRPGYSVLNGDKLAGVIGRTLPGWQTALERYLKTSVKNR